MTAVVVSGAIANKLRNGGEAWVRLSWARGLRRLGFDVWLVEQLPAAAPAAERYFTDVVRAFGFEGRAALLAGAAPRSVGVPYRDLLDVAAEARLLVNISGHLTRAPLLARLRRRAYVDLDPGYTQLWPGAARLAGHDLHFTIAENLGRGDCTLPSAGVRWRAVRQPVVLDDWPVAPARAPRRFTTVASWRHPFGRLRHGARTYGIKLDEFRKVVELPARCAEPFELALDIHPDERPDLELLRRHRWRVVDAPARLGDPEAFRRYVQASGAEFSVAQGVYVETRSGWFSDRTTRYLASGKPALVQDTGFARTLPVGEGLVAFRTLDEAVAGAEAIASEPERHAAAARRIAEEHFDADRVLARFADDCGVAP
ncbi:MAG TPA: hypothetical protein VGJ32_09155 [Solirubrobacteraceae bacterium]